MDLESTNNSISEAGHYKEPEKSRSNMSSRLRSRSELKSSIPKPTPCLRNRDNVKIMSSSSYHSQPANNSRIPLPQFHSAERGKTSSSLQYRLLSTIPNPSVTQPKLQPGRSLSPKAKPITRPKSASLAKNPYSNVKAKVNSKMPLSSKIDNKFSPKKCNEYSEDGSKMSSSLDSTATANSTEKMQLHLPKPKLVTHPKTISPTIKNPYSNIKAKVNTKFPLMSKLKDKISPTNIAAMSSNESSIGGSKLTSTLEPNGIEESREEKSFKNEELLEKQRQLLTIYNELTKLQPASDLQPLEREICRLMQNKTLGHLEGLSQENSFFLVGDGPEFLSTFEKQMQEVTESWLYLICDVISSKSTINNTALACLSLPESMVNVYDELYKFFGSLHGEGDPLQRKLQKIEEEQVKVMTVVMHSVMALSKDYEDLKDKHFRLEKTQDQIHFELKEELAILGEENKELDKKYGLAVEKYNLEKAKAEQQEKQKITINRDISEIKKIVKCIEGRCHEWENKVKKIETACKSLELSVRNKDLISEKESKQHRELQSKFTEAKETITKLMAELAENNDALISLEESNKELKDELTFVKAAQDDNIQNRNELVEELSSKTKKLKEAEVEIEMLRSYMTNSNQDSKITHDITSNVLVDDLTKDIHQRNLQIQELKKKLNNMEHILKENSNREELLLRQISDLQKHPLENEVVLKSQIKDLHYVVKDLMNEKAELEKIIAQKTLELDQRDLLMQEHKQIVQARDELIPMIQKKKYNEKECIQRLSAVIYEHQKTYYNQDNNGYFNGNEQNMYENMKAFENHSDLDPNMVEKELSFRQEKMTELFNLLEHKQMEMMRLERRLRELQGVQEQKEMLDKEKEAHISTLQRELNERKINKPRGFFSFFSGQEESSY